LLRAIGKRLYQLRGINIDTVRVWDLATIKVASDGRTPQIALVVENYINIWNEEMLEHL